MLEYSCMIGFSCNGYVYLSDMTSYDESKMFSGAVIMHGHRNLSHCLSSGHSDTGADKQKTILELKLKHRDQRPP